MAALDWLEAASDRVNKDSAYRSLGSADVDIAFRAGKVIRRVRFDAFSVADIETIDEAGLRDVEVVIDGGFVELPTGPGLGVRLASELFDSSRPGYRISGRR